MANPIVRRSTVAPLKLVTHTHVFETPPQFTFQVDLQINLTTVHHHARECLEAHATRLRCFNMLLFFNPTAAEAHISNFLGVLGTPPGHRPAIARRVSREARRVAASFHSADYGWARIIVNVKIDVFYSRALIIPSPGGDGMVPAAREAVRRSLKRVRVEMETPEGHDDDPNKRSKTTTNCSICLEDIDTCGTSMPCEHLFHEDCIGKWLRQSHYCPLCRFQIPTTLR